MATCVTSAANADVPMSDNILSVLHMAGDILADPARRCTGTMSVDTNGNPVEPMSESACRWCLSGAINKACKELGIESPADQMAVYVTAKDKIGIPGDIAAPVFWDLNDDLHDLIASRLQKA